MEFCQRFRQPAAYITATKDSIYVDVIVIEATTELEFCQRFRQPAAYITATRDSVSADVIVIEATTELKFCQRFRRVVPKLGHTLATLFKSTLSGTGTVQQCRVYAYGLGV